jgi:hypothetical protein
VLAAHDPRHAADAVIDVYRELLAVVVTPVAVSN